MRRLIWSTLFAKVYLSQYFGLLRYIQTRVFTTSKKDDDDDNNDDDYENDDFVFYVTFEVISRRW